MVKKYTETETNSMVETCIKAVNEGKMLSGAQQTKVMNILEGVGKSKGIPFPKYFYYFYRSAAPQGVLMDASNLGLITKQKHQRFIAQRRTLIEIETHLLSLAEIYPEEIFKIAYAHQGKSIEERWRNLKKLSGLNFSKLLNLADKWGRVYNRTRTSKNNAEKERLQKLEKKLREQGKCEAEAVMSAMRSRLAVPFVKKTVRQKQAVRQKPIHRKMPI